MNQNIQKLLVLIALGLVHKTTLGMQQQHQAIDPSFKGGVDSDGNNVPFVDFNDPDSDDDFEERKMPGKGSPMRHHQKSTKQDDGSWYWEPLHVQRQRLLEQQRLSEQRAAPANPQNLPPWMLSEKACFDGYCTRRVSGFSAPDEKQNNNESRTNSNDSADDADERKVPSLDDDEKYARELQEQENAALQTEADIAADEAYARRLAAAEAKLQVIGGARIKLHEERKIAQNSNGDADNQQ